MRLCRYLGLLVSSCVLVSLCGSSVALAAAPVVTSISPNNGPSAGGTTVTIKGSGFITGSTVKFGASFATGVVVNSSTTITATSPAGSASGYGYVDVKVTNATETSATTAEDQYGYDAPPVGPWLGLNGNSSSAYLGPIGDFTAHDITFDRSGEIEWEAGELPSPEGKIYKSLSAGMDPVITIEYKGTGGLPTGSAVAEYVSGFVKSVKAIRTTFPGAPIVYEPINEPWFDSTSYAEAAKQYAAIIAALLPECEKEGIPLNSIYVAAWGQKWVPNMYAAQSGLKNKIQGWYFHPYGAPHGTAYENAEGIESVPVVQSEMTSGQNNIIVSEIGYWTPDVNSAKGFKGGPESVWAENSTQAAQWLREALEVSLNYRRQGWLKALLVYSRNSGGWAMELEHSVLTKQGEALDAFGNSYGLSWLVQPTSNPGSSGASLNDISCASSSSCETVGVAESALAQGWNGTSWSVQTVPNPSEAVTSGLNGVSCTSASACTAVGYARFGVNTNRILAERWNGSEWSLQSMPSTEGKTMGVSCASSSSCEAVGWDLGSGKALTLALGWNGTTWSSQTVPRPTGSRTQWLESVSCSSATACTAAGAYQSSTFPFEVFPFAERWNGTEWSIQTPVRPAGTPKETYLLGVSCPSSSYCVTVGYDKVGSTIFPLAEVWNGTSWAIQTVQEPASGTVLAGVSCASSTVCTAVGEAGGFTAVEHWNGTEWFVQSSANQSGSAEDNLTAISCISPLGCRAAGRWVGVGTPNQTLVESSL